jgi:hypothetical protein
MYSIRLVSGPATAGDCAPKRTGAGIEDEHEDENRSAADEDDLVERTQRWALGVECSLTRNHPAIHSSNHPRDGSSFILTPKGATVGFRPIASGAALAYYVVRHLQNLMVTQASSLCHRRQDACATFKCRVLQVALVKEERGHCQPPSVYKAA